MAESENDRWIQSASNGVLTDFTYDFDVESSSELLIIHYDSTAEEERTNDPAEATPFVEDVDYTVDTGTKTVSFTTAPATGTVTIIGDTDFSNNFSQTDSQPVNTSALNTVNNRHTRAIQQLWTMARQSLRFARRSTLRDKVFPDFSSADDGKSLQVNSVGKLVFGAISEFTGYKLTTIGQNIIEAADASAVQTLLGVSAFIQTLLDDADAATARATLGLVLGTDIYSKTAIDDAFTRIDGTKAFTGDQSMGSNKLTNVTDPTSAQDAATKQYVDTIVDPLQTVLISDDFIGGDKALTGSDDILVTQIGWRVATNGSGATVALQDESPADSDHPGVVRLETGTTSSGYAAIIGPGGAQNLFIGGGQTRFDWAIYIGTLAAPGEDYEIHCGLMDTQVIGSINEGVYFRYDRDTGGNWLAVSEADDTASTEDTGTAVATGWVRLTAIANAAGTSIGYYIDGTLVATITTNLNTDEGMKPCLVITKKNGTTDRDVHADLFALRIDLTNSR